MHVTRGGAQLCLEVTDPSHIGACRRAAQQLAEKWQLDSTGVGRVGIVACELANNLLQHAKGGELLVQPVSSDGSVQIELLALDRGPGMATVDQCMQDGYSTGGTSGTGLGAVRRLSAVFDIYSQREGGSIVLSRVAQDDLAGRPERRTPSARVEFGVISLAMRGETECGDTWSFANEGPSCSVLLVDGLGHGPLAAAAAAEAASTYAERPFDPPDATLRAVHRRLGGTRGAAAACAVFDDGASKVRYAGIGNIAGCIVAAGVQKGLLSHNGTLGLSLARSLAVNYDWPQQALIVMHSDGLTSRWSLKDYPGLPDRHPAVIAAALLRDFSRDRDDATVLVVRRLQ